MRSVLQEMLDALDEGRQVAYCRLVETRGSTPQKAGAAMLVFPDGAQAGTLGGGCVEAEVKRRALAVISDGEAVLETFQLDHDYGWDDGLICGGRMHILIEPIAGDVPDYFRQRNAMNDRDQGATEVIVFDGKASGLRERSSYLLDESGQLVGTLHVGSEQEVPRVVREHLKPVASRPRAYAAHGIAYLPTVSRCRLLIVGGGHVGQAVARMATELDFEVWVVDDREEYVTVDRFPGAEQRIAGTIDDVLPPIEITADTYCLIVTRGHNHDQEALYHLADRGARYVGMIGSRRKIKLIFEGLLNEGVSAECLSRVYAPLGIDIGSQTVPEIAVSICAELVAHRNRDGKVPGRPDKVGLEILRNS
ncbi:MAG: XdhC family protein [Pirellulaceae bacterium]